MMPDADTIISAPASLLRLPTAFSGWAELPTAPPGAVLDRASKGDRIA